MVSQSWTTRSAPNNLHLVHSVADFNTALKRIFERVWPDLRPSLDPSEISYLPDNQERLMRPFYLSLPVTGLEYHRYFFYHVLFLYQMLLPIHRDTVCQVKPLIPIPRVLVLSGLPCTTHCITLSDKRQCCPFTGFYDNSAIPLYRPFDVAVSVKNRELHSLTTMVR